ncbi:uncharacterized protein LOC136039794 isoform X1 [Artemia franciscana]|uniref:uncharacterized protein LOC136039794 isoform X1 n=2 Tax=Artemia franciscana TaxID=6661 RepID=UPI0032DA0608
MICVASIFSIFVTFTMSQPARVFMPLQTPVNYPTGYLYQQPYTPLVPQTHYYQPQQPVAAQQTVNKTIIVTTTEVPVVKAEAPKEQGENVKKEEERDAQKGHEDDEPITMQEIDYLMDTFFGRPSIEEDVARPEASDESTGVSKIDSPLALPQTQEFTRFRHPLMPQFDLETMVATAASSLGTFMSHNHCHMKLLCLLGKILPGLKEMEGRIKTLGAFAPPPFDDLYRAFTADMIRKEKCSQYLCFDI